MLSFENTFKTIEKNVAETSERLISSKSVVSRRSGKVVIVMQDSLCGKYSFDSKFWRITLIQNFKNGAFKDSLLLSNNSA